MCCVCVFFFFKQKTAYEMRISDWSSDVCSSDLRIVCSPDSVNMLSEACATQVPVFVADPHCARGRIGGFLDALAGTGRVRALDGQIGRASCRERVCQYV